MEAVQSSLESLSQSVNGPDIQAEAPAQEEEESTETDVEEQEQEDAGITENAGAEELAQGDTDEANGITEDDYYVVQKGDTLDTISQKVYGDSSQAEAICKMNGLSDGNLIYIGQKLLLP